MAKCPDNPWFRPAIAAMAGYTPGEQPKDRRYLKLNTNENPYPPAPAVVQALRDFDPAQLRLYPDPHADLVRDAAAALAGVTRDWIIAGNGSDDLLTIVVRACLDAGDTLATMDPTYSLYPVLAQLQGARCRTIELTADFGLPANLERRLRGVRLFILARPNAPTGNSFPRDRVLALCERFRGALLIDEAYADFADDHCLDLPRRFPHVIVTRTLSKSYALAGLRLGYAVAQPALIAGLLKVKDSYNADRLTQTLAAAALRDQASLRAAVAQLRATRQRVTAALRQRRFAVVESAANFLFVQPPTALPAADYFRQLRAQGVLVRYFAHSPRTRDHVRITIGTDAEMDELLRVTDNLMKDLP